MADDVIKSFVDDEPESQVDKDIAEKKRVIQRGKDIRAIEKESKEIAKELAYPRATVAKERLTTAKSGILGFVKEIAKEGIRATRPRRTRKGRRRPSMAVPGVYHPVSTDISLTKAIAMNEWSGRGSILDRDFFGNETGERDLLGDRDPEVNIGSKFQTNFFGDKKDLDLIGSTSKVEIDLIGNGKSKKKKEIRYI